VTGGQAAWRCVEVYAVPVPVLALASALALGGIPWFVVVAATFARCDVTRWNARRTFALIRRQEFDEPRPTDCGCRRCTRHRARGGPGV
jgi:hypothetical protein